MSEHTIDITPDWKGLFSFTIATSKDPLTKEMLEFGLRLYKHHEQHHDAEINPDNYEAFTPHHHEVY